MATANVSTNVSAQTLSPEEARAKVLAGESLEGATVNGDLDLAGATVKGHLDLAGATVKGHLDLGGATVKGDLYLRGATVKGNLYLEGATVKGDLYLRGATVGGCLNFVWTKGPSCIYVSPKLAQLVHWSAPTTPLVVVED